MRAVETLRHALSLAVRVDDHFTGAPWPGPVGVALDTAEPPVTTADGRALRHGDGTYRFVAVTPGVRTVTVTPPTGAFAWTATAVVDLATHDRRQAVAIELWPGPQAVVPIGTTAVRGRLVGAVAPGLEVHVEVVGAPPRGRRTRADATGEFLFPVLGMVELTADRQIELEVTVVTRTVDAIQILDGVTNPITVGNRVKVPPGRESRARLTLS
ncbi:MAG: hypothetical protein R3B06_04655 [Kofleriaceae bacterium]